MTLRLSSHPVTRMTHTRGAGFILRRASARLSCLTAQWAGALTTVSLVAVPATWSELQLAMPAFVPAYLGQSLARPLTSNPHSEPLL